MMAKHDLRNLEALSKIRPKALGNALAERGELLLSERKK